MIKRQLPAYSPLGLPAIIHSLAQSATGASRARSELESLLGTRYPCKRVVLTGSGTQALELAIRLAHAGEGNRAPVALPAYTCFDVATAAIGAGVPIYFFDMDPVTLTPDLDSLRRAVLQGASSVVVSNLYGFPLEWDGINEVCREGGATIIEDAAQGLGSAWRGRPGGGFGDATVLSFGRGKGWTGGGGGALMVRSGPLNEAWESSGERLVAKGKGGALSAGLSLAQWMFGRPRLFGIPSAIPGLGLGETMYRAPVPLQAIDAYSAALVRATAPMAEVEETARKEVAEKLMRWFLDLDGTSRFSPCVPVTGGAASFLRFPGLLPQGTPIPESLRSLGHMGVARGYHLPLNEIPEVTPQVKGEAQVFPGARELATALVTLPTHTLLDLRELDTLFRGFQLYLSSRA